MSLNKAKSKHGKSDLVNRCFFLSLRDFLCAFQCSSKAIRGRHTPHDDGGKAAKGGVGGGKTHNTQESQGTDKIIPIIDIYLFILNKKTSFTTERHTENAYVSLFAARRVWVVAAAAL